MTSWRDPLWPEDWALQNDMTPSEWILPRLLPWGAGKGTPVGSIVPTGYPACARVLHPASRTEPDPIKTWREVEVTWREVADWSGRTYHPLMQFGRLSLPRPDSSYPPPYSQEPQTGSLSLGQCQLLYSALAQATTSAEECWLGIWEGLGVFYPGSFAVFGSDRESAELKQHQREMERLNVALEEVATIVGRAPRFAHPGRKYILAKVPCLSACEINGFPFDVTPNLAWPKDRAWCLGSEIDFDSTLVAASEECVTMLLSVDGLEVVRVQPEDRLDIDGDELNSL